MKQIRRIAMLFVAVLALVGAPLVGDGVALAKHARQETKHEASAKSAKSAKSGRSAKSAPAVKARRAAAVAKPEKAVRSGRKGRHVRSRVPVENEEGDVGACAVTGLTVKSAVLFNANTGEVLYEQNPDFQIPPASLTKVLTLYLIFDAIREGRLRPWDVVDVSERASTQGGSNMHLRNGESVKVTELIKGIAVASANDACMAMADYLSGGNADAFVALMNATAKRLGMTNSVFMNPNGLPADGQLTTARDMLKLASAYMEQFPKALTIHSMQFFTHNNRQRHNANSLLGTYEGADGLKTGFVCASGYNIIATAKRGETRLIAVVLGSRNARVRQRETTKLLDRGFKIAEAKLAEAKRTGTQPPLAAAPVAAQGQAQP
jgi:D-alanyl-D-alanine carboxypeptidase (penicillin-binding protein 5/6)